MVKTAGKFVALALLAFVTGAASAQEIHFFKVNSKGQQNESLFIRHRDEPGCHNILRGRDIFRVSQIGFTYCTVYAAKDCDEDSALIMIWKGRAKKNSARAQPTERLMPGDMWYFEDNGVREVESWKCVP